MPRAKQIYINDSREALFQRLNEVLDARGISFSRFVEMSAIKYLDAVDRKRGSAQ